ncbi:MAG: CD225/dispanin family protein [Thermoguttaceae bacterium]|nr:CD225/dispanin family protein [Thermoguttaceae bacterium]
MPNWFYYDATGTKQGPINNAQLKALARSGIITPQTKLETDTGQSGNAGQIRGLFSVPEPNPFAAGPEPTQPPPIPMASMVYCTHCGSPVGEQAVACMKCGASPMGHNKFCRRCGAQLNAEQIVCVKCGTRIAAAHRGRNDISCRAGYVPRGTYDGNGAGNVPDCLVWGILEMLFCNFVFGLISVIYSTGARKAANSGNYDLAVHKADIARRVAKEGFWLSIIMMVIALVVGLIVGVCAAIAGDSLSPILGFFIGMVFNLGFAAFAITRLIKILNS